MREIIKEEKVQTVNDVQLKDLYDAACKTEQQIINLSIASMSFSNPQIKKSVVALKSQASQLTQLIGGAMQIDDNINLGLNQEKPVLDGPDNDSEKIIESVSNLMKVLNFTKSQATSLFETFDFKKDVIEKQDKNDEEGEREIDMTESFKNINNGELKNISFDNFKNDVVKTLNEAKLGSNKNSIYLMIVDDISNSRNIKEINEGFNKLYDYADEKNIEIRTK